MPFPQRSHYRHDVATSRTLVVKCTAGAEEPERCAQAFTVAATALAAGAAVSLWLTGEAAWLATPGRAEVFELRTRRRWPNCATQCSPAAG